MNLEIVKNVHITNWNRICAYLVVDKDNIDHSINKPSCLASFTNEEDAKLFIKTKTSQDKERI